MAFEDDKLKVAAYLYRTDGTPLNDLRRVVAYAFDNAGNALQEGAQIDSDPGSEKVTNGTFTGAATGWTLTSGWAYSSNTVLHNSNGTTTLSQNVSAVANEIYRLVYTISSWSVGTVTPTLGGVDGLQRGADGTYTEYILATGTGNLIFTPSNTARFTIDDVSVKRVGVMAADRVVLFEDDRGGTAGKGGLVIVAEDGTEHIFADRAGIGTSEPNHTLELHATANCAIGLYEDNASDSVARNWVIRANSNASGDVAFEQSTAQGLNPVSSGIKRLIIGADGVFQWRMHDSAGTPVAPTAALRMFAHNKSVVDDGIVTCPAITTNAYGWVVLGTGAATRTMFFVNSTGTVTLLNNTGDVVANADTDTNLCIGTAAAQEPLQVKNRLGSTQIVNLVMWYD